MIKALTKNVSGLSNITIVEGETLDKVRLNEDAVYQLGEWTLDTMESILFTMPVYKCFADVYTGSGGRSKLLSVLSIAGKKVTGPVPAQIHPHAGGLGHMHLGT